MKRALVTGGAGFIGSNLCDRLVADGCDVLALDDMSTGTAANFASASAAGAQLIEADVAAGTAVTEAIAAFQPDAVFHLAARASVGASVADPLEDARVNVLGTLATLNAAQAGGVARFVYVSTGGAVYGDVTEYPTPETSPISPESPYGTSKYAGEMYTRLFNRLHGMSTATLRLANIYGPRQDAHGEGGVVAIFSKAMVSSTPVTVNGDGLQTRDFVMVDDVVSACLAAANSSFTGACNIATGQETSVLDLIEGLEAAAAGELDFKHGPERDGEVRRSLLDPSLAAQALGWQAATGLEQGLRATLAWQQSTLS